MQPVDAITLVAVCWELTQDWLPARVEQVIQRDRFTIAMGLRTLHQRGWLTLSWHPQAARLGMAEAPPRTPDTFTLSQQLKHQLNGLALTQVTPLTSWERVVDLQFAQRPGEAPLWHVYLEVMGQYSNLILTNADHGIVTAARQVSSQQSSLREIQTGDRYMPPPRLTRRPPTLSDSQAIWREQVSLIPGALGKMILKCYQGLSTAVVHGLLTQVGLSVETPTPSLTPQDWDALFQVWQASLHAIADCHFQPSLTRHGYAVLPGHGTPIQGTIQALIADYYRQHLDQQTFQQLHHQLQHKVTQQLGKLQQKIVLFQARLHESELADQFREQADLLMAYLHEWQPGLTDIVLQDFATNHPVKIPLNPEKNAVQNAQALYKQHQKLKRSRDAVAPLLATTQQELHYLSQVEDALQQLASNLQANDLLALQEIQEELIQQGYLADPYAQRSRPTTDDPSLPYRYQSPSGFDVWVGRNNRQNDWLTFRVAGDYDLWFHTQEIPGSHVLLRLNPGASPDEPDLQFTADLAAYYSRGRQSDQVPVVFTEPRYVFKPKGTRPGMVVYQHERVQWGHPAQVADLAQLKAIWKSP
jgi:predicted ribosome quality control (RQC) complex YloA/Tae2 family protein